MGVSASATGLGNRFLVLLILGLLCGSPWLGGGTFVLCGMVVLLPVVIGFGDVASVHLVLIFLCSSLVAHLGPTAQAAVLGKVGGILLYFYVVVAIGPLRRSVGWMRVGRIDRKSLLMMVGIVLVSAVGVILWARLVPQSAAVRSRILPAGISGALLPVYMAGFAMINALIEEIVWRGVEMSAIEKAFGVGMFALVLQAVQFGLAHYRAGFPNGWSGAGLAMMFGLLMGILRMRTKGLFAGWCAHAAAHFCDYLFGGVSGGSVRKPRGAGVFN